MTIQQIIDEQKQNINEEEIEKLLKNRVYALICEDCGGGGADGQDNCKKCDGHGLHTWETTKLKNDLTEIITTHTRKLIEAVGEEVIGKNEPVRLQEVEVGPEGCTVYDVTEDISIFRNYLRDDQRLKLKEIINSLK